MRLGAISRIAFHEGDIHVVQSKLHGYHVYEDLWEASIGEKLDCRREDNNIHNPYSVAVIDRGNVTVGHVPREISSVCSLF
jgi:hypothetical protein